MKFELDDIMTTQEAAERWIVTADSLKQNCRGRVKNGFREGEFKKSGKMWLVTRQGMERLYGKEKTMKTYEITTNKADELLNALLEMSYQGEKHGMNIPLSFVEDATEIADMEGAEALGHSPAVFTDCGEVAAIDPNGSAEDLYNVIRKLNTYDLECVVVSD